MIQVKVSMIGSWCFATLLSQLLAPSSASLPGGYTETTLEPEKQSSLISLIEPAVNQQLGDEPSLVKVVEILQTWSQVVAGINYKVNVSIGETDCPKNEFASVGDCKVKSDGSSRICEVVVYEQPWQNVSRVTGVRCS